MKCIYCDNQLRGRTAWIGENKMHERNNPRRALLVLELFVRACVLNDAC